MNGGVIRPFGQGQKTKPPRRLVMDEGTEVLLQGLIEDLRLLVGLRVVGGAHSELGAAEFEQVPPEMTYENRIMV